MKKFSLMVAACALAFAPLTTAGAYGTSTRHDVKQYFQNRITKADRRICRINHGRIVKRNNHLVCIYPKRR